MQLRRHGDAGFFTASLDFMTQKPHKPNVVPANVRVALTIAAVCLIAYMCAGMATGYTYLPGKRGGFLLSGFPTLLVVLAASGLFVAALLTIVDHYDKRPNEASYKSLRTSCLKSALYLFIAAPFVELAKRILLLWGVDVFPEVHGLAENYTFYSPELSALVRHIEPITSHGWLIALLAFATGGLGILIDKHSSGLHRLVAALFGISMLGLASLLLASSTQDFLSGKVDAGRRSHKHEVRALDEPAKFNAILLTHFSLGGMMFTASALLLAGALTNRVKPPRLQSSKAARTRVRAVSR